MLTRSSALNIPAKLLYDYQGQTDDELKVQEGASVVICEKLEDAWADILYSTSRPGSARPTTPASNAPAPPKASAAALAQL